MVGRDELIACGIHNWYNTFAEYTFKTAILKLPDEFIRWLEQDGVFLARNSTAVRIWHPFICTVRIDL